MYKLRLRMSVYTDMNFMLLGFCACLIVICNMKLMLNPYFVGVDMPNCLSQLHRLEVIVYVV